MRVDCVSGAGSTGGAAAQPATSSPQANKSFHILASAPETHCTSGGSTRGVYCTLLPLGRFDGAFAEVFFDLQLGVEALEGRFEVVFVGVLGADKFNLGAELRVVEAPAADFCVRVGHLRSLTIPRRS